MPTNLGPEAISAVKAGHADVVAMYAGNTQIFPNEVELQSAAYTDTSDMSTAGGSRIFRVIGEIGCSYSLSGSLSGSYNLATSPFDHTVTASYNGSCTATSRSFPLTLTPLGNTTLQGGGSTFTSSFTQSGGPGITYYTPSGSVTVTNTNYVTTTVSGQLRWVQGAAWSIAWTYNDSRISDGNLYVAPGLAGSYSGTLPGSSSSGSGTATFTLGAQSTTQVAFGLSFNSTGCNEAYNITSATQYP